MFEVFDIECYWHNNNGHLLALSYSDKDEIKYLYCYGLDDNSIALHILNNFKENCLYYAHNLIFDFSFLIIGLNNLNVGIKIAYFNDKLFEVKLEHGGKVLTLRCSYNLLPFSLDSLSAIYTKSEKMYFPYFALKNWKPNCPCNEFSGIKKTYHNLNIREYLKLYCENDVTLLKTILNKFILSLSLLGIKIGKKNFTLSNIMLNYYKTNWNYISTKVEKKITTVLKHSYFGGRCEIFGNQYDNDKILYYDFKKMYRSCMLEKLPCGNFYIEDYTFNDTKDLDFGFYNIEIEYYKNIPILPIKTDKLYFKTGVIRGWYWFEEIKEALSTGLVKNFKTFQRCYSDYYYNGLEDFVFNIDKLFIENYISENIYKLMLNSLYGRLGVNGDIIKGFLVKSPDNYKEYRQIGSNIIINKQLKTLLNNNVAVAAAITSKARIKLYRAMMEIENLGGKLLYCDTDSIFASFDNKTNMKNLNFKNIIYKDNEIIDTVFIKPKTYAIKFKDHYVIKIKGMSYKELDYDYLKRCFYNKDEFLKVSNTRLIRSGGSYMIEDYDYKIALQDYNKREWIDDKKNTKPICIT